jgi:hypothetical protein
VHTRNNIAKAQGSTRSIDRATPTNVGVRIDLAGSVSLCLTTFGSFPSPPGPLGPPWDAVDLLPFYIDIPLAPSVTVCVVPTSVASRRPFCELLVH